MNAPDLNDAPAAPPDWLARTAEDLTACELSGLTSADQVDEALALLGTIEAERLMAPIPLTDGRDGSISLLWPTHDKRLKVRVLSARRCWLQLVVGNRIFREGECGPVALRDAILNVYPYVKSRWGGGKEWE